MANSKPSVPSPAIFQSDPEEQIYARGTLDRDMSGLAYMFKNAAEQRRVQDQQTYMEGVDRANKLATMLGLQEERAGMLKEALKQGPEYAKAGLPISQVPIIAQLFSSLGTDDQTMDASSLVNALKRSEIAKNSAAAAASGRESGPEYTGETIVTPSGVSQESIRVKQKGGNLTTAQELQRQRVIQALEARGIKGGGPGGTGLPNANPVDVGKTQEYLRGRWGG